MHSDADINRHPVILGLPPCTQESYDLAQRALTEKLLVEAYHLVQRCHRRNSLRAYLTELGDVLRGMGQGWYCDADERMRIDRARYLQLRIQEILAEVWS